MDQAILVVEGAGVLTSALAPVKAALHLSLHVASDALQAISLIQMHQYIALVIDEKVGYVDGWAMLRYLEDNQIPLYTLIVPSGDDPPGFDQEFRRSVRVHLGDLPEVIAERIRALREGPRGPAQS